MSRLNQEMTDHDLAAWMDGLLTRIELWVLMEHEVISHQEDDAGCCGLDCSTPHTGRSGLSKAVSVLN
jgi:hypothetical protein